MTMQLRRYEVVDGQMDALLEWIPTVIAVREKFGFKIEFMLVDRENNELVWAVSHPGDYDAAYEEFVASPERAAAFEGQPKRVDQAHVAWVETVIAPGS
jgi:F420-0:gamma-glutamyl ligase